MRVTKSKGDNTQHTTFALQWVAMAYIAWDDVERRRRVFPFSALSEMNVCAWVHAYTPSPTAPTDSGQNSSRAIANAKEGDVAHLC